MAQCPVQCCYLSKVAALGEEAGDSGCGGVAGVRAGLAIKEWGGTHELSVKRNKESDQGLREARRDTGSQDPSQLVGAQSHKAWPVTLDSHGFNPGASETQLRAYSRTGLSQSTNQHLLQGLLHGPSDTTPTQDSQI